MSGLGLLADMKPFQTNIVEPRTGSREQRIIELVRDRGVAAIQDLASEFDVTPQTIRRGVNRLLLPGSIVAAILLVAIAAPLLPLPDPIRQDVARRLAVAGFLALAPLALLLPTGLYLFVAPYAAKRRAMRDTRRAL